MKEKVISVRLSDEEYAMLAARAEKEGYSVAVLVRQLIKGVDVTAMAKATNANTIRVYIAVQELYRRLALASPEQLADFTNVIKTAMEKCK